MVFYYFNSVNEFRYTLMENVQMDYRHIFLRNLAFWFSASKLFYFENILLQKHRTNVLSTPWAKFLILFHETKIVNKVGLHNHKIMDCVLQSMGSQRVGHN